VKTRKISLGEREKQGLGGVFGACLIFVCMCVMKKNFLSSEEMHNLCGVCM
jgi:hypothetical protein